ncbi:hypothetical protein [Bacillus altitudinis]|uniref:hypothetical protein n=1 Tax=Bacillus altitudinis TaxID=293387 RepID=UPI00372B0AA4
MTIDDHLIIRVDVVRALIGLEGNCMMGSTLYSNTGINLDGLYKEEFENKRVKFFIDASEVELLREAKDFEEVYEIYKGIGYFSEV